MIRVTYWGLFKNAYHLGLLALTFFTSFATFFGLAKSQRSEYYASIAMSMSKSFSNFFFGAIDPAGTVTLDKIPGSFWLPAIFVKLFGFSTWAILAPNAILTVLFVLIVTMIGKRIGGARAGLIAGAIAAATPIVIAVGRANQPQSAFLFTLAISALWAVKSLQSQSRKDLIITGLFIALAFHTYMLEAWALWPALIIAWFFTKEPLGKKIVDLLIAGSVSLFASLIWILTVWSIPASHRPYVGGTYHNNPFEMVFGYNGLGRFSATSHALSSATDDPTFRSFTPPFGGSAGFGRIFNNAVAGQVAWVIPAAIFAVIALILMKKINSINVFISIWLATFFAMFSLVAGIHQFYTSSLSIPAALLIAVALTAALDDDRELLLSFLILAGSISALLIANKYSNYIQWASYVQAALALIAITLVIYKFKQSRVVAALILGSLIFAPAAWSFDAHRFTNSINPVAGNVNSMGGGFGGPGGGRNFGGTRPNFTPRFGNGQQPNGQMPNFTPRNFNGGGNPGGNFGQQNVSSTVKYLQANRNGAKYLLVTFGAQSAASYITATGENIMPVGGFDGQDPTPTLAKFKELVAKGEVRYVLAGGGRGGMGGQQSNNEISSWVTANCQVDGNAPINSLYLCTKG
jgi:4-amino-4-deoxy-L-arabinose transferase-like glycosyltransferase